MCGGQTRGLEGGTLNVPGIVGFGEVCRIAQQEWKDEAERIGRLRDRLEQALPADFLISGSMVTQRIGFQTPPTLASEVSMHER